MAEQTIVYAFEELSDDLPRPPFSALRALMQTGAIPSPKGWRELPVDVRLAIARRGIEGVVNTAAVRQLVEQVSPRCIRLVPPARDPNPDRAPQGVVLALGPGRALSDAQWRGLRSLDRSVLASLAANPRLLCRAYDELCPFMGKGASSRRVRWRGELARCVLVVDPRVLDRLWDAEFLGGRALLLARAAGIRSARRTATVLDLHAESATGPVELDVTTLPDQTGLLWQAHVSAWDGSFFPAASLLAVTAAATATLDMLRSAGANASISDACIREEQWVVGDQIALGEEATAKYDRDKLVHGVDVQAAALALHGDEERSEPLADSSSFETLRDLAPLGARAKDDDCADVPRVGALVDEGLEAARGSGNAPDATPSPVLPPRDATPIPSCTPGPDVPRVPRSVSRPDVTPVSFSVPGPRRTPPSSNPTVFGASEGMSASNQAPWSLRRGCGLTPFSKALAPRALRVILGVSAVVLLAALTFFVSAFLFR
ncbi:MAG: hypothetical protein MUF54_16845 [Polyangiaceae bacterium]|jgi:molybdenum cofactor biosynthesis enzyme|nr:hypothetical protein [Polyangiaceae bacterium]